MGTLLITIISDTTLVSLLTFFIMSGLVLFAARIPVRVYAKLLIIPLFFLGVGVLSLVIHIHPENALYGFSFFDMRWGINREGLSGAWFLFVKSMGAVSCLYFMILTVPFTEIINISRKMKIPILFLEIVILVYKFFFIIMETMNQIYVSQNSRLGYRNYKTGFKSTGKLATSLFVISLKRYEDMYSALESRCFTGDFHFYSRQFRVSPAKISAIIILDGLLFGLNYFFRGVS